MIKEEKIGTKISIMKTIGTKFSITICKGTKNNTGQNSIKEVLGTKFSTN